MLTYNELKEKARDFLAATSLTVEEFQLLLPFFIAAYRKIYPSAQTLAGALRQRQAGGGAKGRLESFEDRLLFILVYQKTHPLQTMHGLQFGMSQSSANHWIHHLLPVLQQALADSGHQPERDGSKLAAHPLATEVAPNLVIDGTERRRERPQDHQVQKEHYSGKRRAHTDKNIILVNENTTKVAYLGPTTPGKTHDKKMADNENIRYPDKATLDKDSGFQAYEPENTINTQTKKKPKGKELSLGDKLFNQAFASLRIVVEHAISGVKRCRIVKDVLRLTKAGISDLVMEIACGLHNLRVSCRKQIETVDLLSFLSAA